jgi:hypothetical protein
MRLELTAVMFMSCSLFCWSGYTESVWQLGLTVRLYSQGGGGAEWRIFWRTTRNKAICCHRLLREVLGQEHLCFFVHAAAEKLDLRGLQAGYSEEEHPAYQVIMTEAYPKIVNS